MNGIFDSINNKKYHDAKPNYDESDGIDSIKCDEPSCIYYDIERDRCLFETCIMKQFPFSVPYHTLHTSKCEICGKHVKHCFDDTTHPFTDFSRMCERCHAKLVSLLRDDTNIDKEDGGADE